VLGSPLVMLLLMFLVIWLMLIRPQQKKAKEHKLYLDRLTRGDMVVTNGGIIGKLVNITENVVTLEVAKDVRIQLLKSQIAGPPPQTGSGAAASASGDKGGKKGK